jgi:transposase InsO family protein
MAEALNSLFKAECIRNPVLRGSGWRSIDDVELAVATYIDWYNHRRLHGLCGHGDYAAAAAVVGSQRRGRGFGLSA